MITLFISVHMTVNVDRTESTFMHLCVQLYEGIMSLKSALNNKLCNSSWSL